jgi:hypothetical protein
MPKEHERQQDTKEFLAQWNAATELVLTDRLTEILVRLAELEAPDAASRSTVVATLAPHVLHALQAAGTPGSTVHDAIDYLADLTKGRAGDADSV